MRPLFIVTLLFACLSAFSQKGVSSSRPSSQSSLLDTNEVDHNARFAFIVGNAAYDPGRLNNPVNDADSIANVLAGYGFTVTVARNRNMRQLEASIDSFSKMVKLKRGIGLFYFSGHGLQVNNMNFLVPLQASFSTPAEIDSSMIALNTVLSKIAYSEKGFNIVILDACRDSPFSNAAGASKGLTHALKKTKNTYVFFATSSGDVAEDGSGVNSPFTEALIKSIRLNDSIELTQVAKQVTREVESKTAGKQVPQAVSTISSDFYFRKKAINSKPRMFLLSVGVSDYKDDRYDLMYSSKGALDFVKAFRAQPPGIYEEIVSYSYIDKEATRSSFYEAIKTIRRSAAPGDVILVYYSGNIESDADNIYLMPSDADFSDPASLGISRDEILSVLGDLPCKTMLFLDAPGASQRSKQMLFDELAKPRNNVCVISASSESEFAFESTEHAASVFSYALMTGLDQAESIQNKGYIDVGSLCAFIVKRVSDLTMGRQTAQVIYPSGWQNFILAKPRSQGR